MVWTGYPVKWITFKSEAESSHDHSGTEFFLVLNQKFFIIPFLDGQEISKESAETRLLHFIAVVAENSNISNSIRFEEKREEYFQMKIHLFCVSTLLWSVESKPLVGVVAKYFDCSKLPSAKRELDPKQDSFSSSFSSKGGTQAISLRYLQLGENPELHISVVTYDIGKDYLDFGKCKTKVVYSDVTCHSMSDGELAKTALSKTTMYCPQSYFMNLWAIIKDKASSKIGFKYTCCPSLPGTLPPAVNYPLNSYAGKINVDAPPSNLTII